MSKPPTKELVAYWPDPDVSIVKIGTAVVPVAMLHAYTMESGMVDVDDWP